MHIKRKNYDHGRIKRSNRKPKTFEAFNSIFGTYFKLLLIWVLILMLDFFTDFRFEFLYSCWLFFRTVFDSFRYQGLAFALSFTLIALTSDLICYFLVPTALIYLLGSSLVWVQLIWQADRGVYGPTMVFCFLFVYVEVAVRLRDPKTLPLSIDLCRPFAAHCIGYPAVSLGFGLKTMVAHHLRLRRQRSVEAQNMTFFTLLEEALPKEFRYYFKPDVPTKSKSGSPTTSVPSCPALTAPNTVTASRANGVASVPADKSHPTAPTPNSVSRRHTHNTNNNSSSNQTTTSTSGASKSDTHLATDCTDSCVQLHEPSACVPACSDVFGSGTRSFVPLHESNPEFVQRDPDTTEKDRFYKTSSGVDNPGNSWSSSATDVLDESFPVESLNARRTTPGSASRDYKVTHHGKAPVSSVCSASSSGSSGSVASSNSSLSSSSSICLSHNQPLSSAGPSCLTRSAAVDSRNPGTGATAKSGAVSGNASTITTSSSKSSTTSTITPTGSGNKSNPGGCKHPQKDEYTLKLETEVRQLKSELQSLRSLEIDLRTQVQQLTAAERTHRSESAQARQESESLQAKLNQLTQRLQVERTSHQAAEKRLAEERKQRAMLEQQIAAQQQQQKTSRSSGRTRKDVQDDSANSQLGGASVSSCSKTPTSSVSRGTSTVASSINASSSFVGACLGGGTCAKQIEELQAELHALTREVAAKDLQLVTLKDSRASSFHVNGPNSGVNSGAHRMQGSFKGAESTKTAVESSHPSRRVHPDPVGMAKTNSELRARLNSLQEENQRLADTLKDEDKMKQELISAYHSSLKEIGELNDALTKKDYQIVELNMRMEHLTPQLCDYMHMLNGQASGDTALIPTNANKLLRPQQQAMWPNSQTDDAENHIPYSTSSHSSANSNLLFSKSPTAHKPGAGDELSYGDPRLTHLASNGAATSQQSSSTNLLSSPCAGQNNYGSSALDVALRGLGQTSSGRTMSPVDYGPNRINSSLTLQAFNAPALQSRIEPNSYYGGQPIGAHMRQTRTNTSDVIPGMQQQQQQQHLPYQSPTSMNPAQLGRCKSSSSGTANRMQSPCPYSMSSGRPLPVGSSAPPTSPPPFMAPPPGLYDMSNTTGSGNHNHGGTSNINNNAQQQLNGHTTVPFRPSSSSSTTSGPVTSLDLQPIFVSTPLEVVVQSDGQLPVGFVPSPANVELVQRSSGPNTTSLACLMDSLSPLTAGNAGARFFGTKSASDMRERSLSHVLTDVAQSSGNALLGPLSDPGRRSHSTVPGTDQGFNTSPGSFMSSTFNTAGMNNVGSLRDGFLPIDSHPMTTSFDYSVAPPPETRAISLDPEGSHSGQLVDPLDNKLFTETKKTPS